MTLLMEFLDARLTLRAFCILVISWFYLRSRRSRTSPISTVPGPPTSSWIFGHSLQLLLSPTHGQHEFEWKKTYRPVSIQGCFGQERLMVSDPHALVAIYNLNHFDHTPTLANAVYLLQGPLSLNYVLGQTHKRFRTALNPGFSAASVRRYQPIFEQAAHQLCDALAGQLQDLAACNIDVLRSLEKATLNSMSQAVFGIPVKDMGDELVSGVRDLTILASSLSPLTVLLEAVAGQLHLPQWLLQSAGSLPTHAMSTLRNIRIWGSQLGKRLVQERVEALTAENGLQDDEDQDVFAQLVAAANTRSGSRPAHTTMSLEEIAGQTSVIIVAGQETASNALAFALLELARNTKVQSEIRAEISMAASVDVQNMPLLEAFVKEVLRFYTGIPLAERIALCDTVLPLQTPLKTVTGETVTSILVRKGEIVVGSSGAYHRLARWGADAHEFRPSRWLDGTIKLQDGEAVGPYANLATFLGGNRVCIGWRFAILEIHILLVHLVQRFHFALPDGEWGDARGIGRPKLAGTLMPTMPLGHRGLELRIEAVPDSTEEGFVE
ncbi:cytochrome P450 [Mycena amicta]|nr:cytochrome P450 [Mycena amicta]